MAPKTYAQKKTAEDAAKFARDTGTRVAKATMQTQREACDPRSWEAVCKTAPKDRRVDVGSYERRDRFGVHNVNAHCRNTPLHSENLRAHGVRQCGTTSANDKRAKATAKAASKAAAKKISEKLAAK